MSGSEKDIEGAVHGTQSSGVLSPLPDSEEEVEFRFLSVSATYQRDERDLLALGEVESWVIFMSWAHSTVRRLSKKDCYWLFRALVGCCSSAKAPLMNQMALQPSLVETQ